MTESEAPGASSSAAAFGLPSWWGMPKLACGPARQGQQPATAAAVRGDCGTCLAAGIDDYIPKLASIATLQVTLERWIQPAAATMPRG